MRYLDKETIENKISEKISKSKNIESDLRSAGLAANMIAYQPNVKRLLHNYFLGNKEVNKLKRLDPSLNIIDADDIDWSGYGITFNGRTFNISSTYDLLDLIFRLIADLYTKHGVTYLAWNDMGDNRSYDNLLDWGIGGIIDNDTHTIYDKDSSNTEWGESLEN
jgi:hypothetical protein